MMRGGDSGRRARGEAQRLEGLPRAMRRRMRTSFSTLRDFLLRGGRLTKVARTVASYAPSLGRAGSPALATASALAVAAGMSALWGATAGEALAAGASAKGGIVASASPADPQAAAQASGEGAGNGEDEEEGASVQGTSTVGSVTTITGTNNNTVSLTGLSWTSARLVEMEADATISATGATNANGIDFGFRVNSPLTFIQKPNGGKIWSEGHAIFLSNQFATTSPTFSITTTGTLTTNTRSSDGLYVTGPGGRSDAHSDSSVTISVNDINAQRHGIHLKDLGQKTVSITVAGEVRSIGSTSGSRRRPRKEGQGIRMTMSNRGETDGGRPATARADIFVSGTVTGGGVVHAIEANRAPGASFAIYTAAKFGVPINIVIQSGGSVGALSTKIHNDDATLPGRAILDSDLPTAGEANYGADTTITVQSGGTLLGQVSLNKGVDKVHVLGGGSFRGSFDGGGDAGAAVSPDSIVLESGAVGTLSSLRGVGTVTVNAGATLKVDGGTASDALDKVFGLTAAGTLDLADGHTHSLTLGDDPTSTQNNRQVRDRRIPGTFTGGGTVKVDFNIDKKEADRFIVRGDITGQTLVELVTTGSSSSLGVNDLVLLFHSEEDIVPCVVNLQGQCVAGVPSIPVGALSRDMVRIDNDQYVIRFRPDQRKFYVKIPGTCTLDTGSAVHTCVDEIINTQDLTVSGGDKLDVRLAPNAWAASRSGNAFSLTGGGAGDVSFVQSATSDDVRISGHYDYITGNHTAIDVNNTGGGTVTVTTIGTVTGKGIATSGTTTSGTGIRVFTDSSGGEVTINTATATGANFGIWVKSESNATVTIMARGPVTGGAGAEDAAIQTETAPAANATLIKLESGAVAGASGRAAIRHTGGAASVTVSAGAAIAGSVVLGTGNDTLTFAGGAVRSAALDGGAGDDSLLFQSGASGIVTGLANFGTLSVESGANVSVNVAGTVSLTSLTLGGALDFGDTHFTDLKLDGDMVGGGAFTINVDFAQNKADRLLLSGKGTVTGSPTAINVAATGTGTNEVVIAEITGQDSIISLDNWARFAVADTDAKLYTVTPREAGRKLVIFRNGCFESSQGSGAFTCRGAVIGSAQTLSAAGKPLSVNLAASSRVETSGIAFSLTQTGAGGIDFDQSAASAETIGSMTIHGNAGGIKATNSGAGKIEILTTSTVTALSGHGIHAVTGDASGEGVTITAADVVSSGTGNFHGVFVDNSPSKTPVLITLSGDVRGAKDGIHILGDTNNDAEDPSDATVSVSGSVSGATGKGVYAKGDYLDFSLSVTGAVTAATHGIYTYTVVGDADISVSGPITVTGSESIGIHARIDESGVDYVHSIDVEVAAVTAGAAGIVAINNSPGATRISASGPVRATKSDGRGGRRQELRRNHHRHRCLGDGRIGGHQARKRQG